MSVLVPKGIPPAGPGSRRDGRGSPKPGGQRAHVDDGRGPLGTRARAKGRTRVRYRGGCAAARCLFDTYGAVGGLGDGGIARGPERGEGLVERGTADQNGWRQLPQAEAGELSVGGEFGCVQARYGLLTAAAAASRSTSAEVTGVERTGAGRARTGRASRPRAGRVPPRQAYGWLRTGDGPGRAAPAPAPSEHPAWRRRVGFRGP